MQSCRSVIFSRTEAVVQQRWAGQSTLCSVNVQPQCQSPWVPLRGAVSRWSRQTLSSVPALGGFQLSWVVLGRFVWDGEWWGSVQGSARFLQTPKITFLKKKKNFKIYKEISLIGQSETLKQHYSFGFFCDCVQPLCLSLLRLSVWVKLAYCQGPFPFTKLDKTLFLLFELSF